MQLPALLSTLLLLTPIVLSAALPQPEPEALKAITGAALALGAFALGKHMGNKDSDAPAFKLYKSENGEGESSSGEKEAKTNKCYGFGRLSKAKSLWWDLGKKGGVKVQGMFSFVLNIEERKGRRKGGRDRGRDKG